MLAILFCHRLSTFAHLLSRAGLDDGELVEHVYCTAGEWIRDAAAAGEAGSGGGAEQGRVDHQEVTRGTGEDQLCGVTT